jgi:hypothetical protein
VFSSDLVEGGALAEISVLQGNTVWQRKNVLLFFYAIFHPSSFMCSTVCQNSLIIIFLLLKPNLENLSFDYSQC